MNLFRPLSGNNVPGLIGAENASSIILPFPGKKIVSIEGFNNTRTFAVNVATTNIITPSVENEFYLIDIIYSLLTNTVKETNFISYRISNQPPPGIGNEMILRPVLNNVDNAGTNTIQYFGILCTELSIDNDLVIGPPLEQSHITLNGYKLITENI